MNYVEEIPQAAQKCAWCNMYLMVTDGGSFALYNGPDLRYRGWLCHEECNICPIDTAPISKQPEIKLNNNIKTDLAQRRKTWLNPAPALKLVKEPNPVPALKLVKEFHHIKSDSTDSILE